MWDPACTRRLHLPPLPAAATPQHIPACLSSSSNATAPKARPSPLGIQLAFNNSAFLGLEQQQQQCDTPQNNDHNPPPPPWSRQPSRGLGQRLWSIWIALQLPRYRRPNTCVSGRWRRLDGQWDACQAGGTIRSPLSSRGNWTLGDHPLFPMDPRHWDSGIP
ncbi:hypothetical protein D9613_011071 [Agrocybe pediades]|uniref:Uncharacterized protein n=1 Tax=Agrocybe pediades TaxID=84607 RepID=A0A8H4VKV0_9AGAR|nr:hypothetical protein D9613_011071 [Agrocybe pediades]